MYYEILVVANAIDDWVPRKVTTPWPAVNALRILKMLLPLRLRKRIQTLLSGESVSLLVRLMTCMIGRFAEHMGYSENYICSSCLNMDD